MKCIVTGSFDPFTLGHVEIVKGALERFDKVYVVALLNEDKNYMFTLEQKQKIIELSTGELENVVVDSYAGFTADYMHKNEIRHIVRGYRNSSDLEYEEKLASQMKSFDENFETIFIKCDEKFSEISSTRARKAIEGNTKMSDLIHPSAILYIKTIINSSID